MWRRKEEDREEDEDDEEEEDDDDDDDELVVVGGTSAKAGGSRWMNVGSKSIIREVSTQALFFIGWTNSHSFLLPYALPDSFPNW